ncbi:MAG: thioredoxin [Lachnospiraceae bacterium]
MMIDFWASWCGPCKMFSPIVDELAKEQEGKVKVGKINIDEEQELAQKYGVMSIPTVILFKDGKNAAVSVGVQSKAAMNAFIQK